MKRLITRKAKALAIVLVAGMGCLSMFSIGALAVQPDEVLKDAKLENRARELSTELRCLVCQNQSIDDSNAPLARDLRLLVRERLTAGDTNEQTLAFIVERYGEFVLLRPTFTLHNLVLWLTPLIGLLGGGLLALRYVKGAGGSGGKNAVEELSDHEQARLDELLKGAADQG